MFEQIVSPPNCGITTPRRTAILGSSTKKGPVPVPEVDSARGAHGINPNHRYRSLDGSDYRLRHERSEAKGKALLFCVVEMALIAKDENLVLEQQSVDRGNRLRGKSPDSLMFLISAPMGGFERV